MKISDFKKFVVDFDGRRRVLRIRKKTAARLLRVNSQQCPLAKLDWHDIGRYTRTRKLYDGKMYTDRRYSFQPYAEEMSNKWLCTNYTTRRRWCLRLARMYERGEI